MDDRAAHEFYANPENLAIAGPAHKRKRPRLTSMATVRFKPEVIEAVKEIAHGEGITVSSWIRRTIQRAVTTPEPEMVELSGAEPIRMRAEVLRELTTALMPALMKHGTVTLTVGPPEVTSVGAASMTTQNRVSVGWPERPQGLIEGSGRRGENRMLPSTRPHTFICPHFSIGNVISAACVYCGPLAPAM